MSCRYIEYVPIAHTTKLRIQLNSPSRFSKHATMRRHGHVGGPNRMSGQKNYPDRGTDRRIVSTKSTCLLSLLRIFLSRPPRALCSDRPIRITKGRVDVFTKFQKNCSPSLCYFLYFCTGILDLFTGWWER